MTAFSPLETAILQAACDLHPEHARVLLAQIAAATVNMRENTGSGFYTDIEVDPASPKLLPAKFLSDVLVTLCGGVRLNCLVFVRFGHLAMIEAFTMNEDTSAIDFLTAPFSPPLPDATAGATRH